MTDLRQAAQQALEALEADPLEMVADANGHMVFLKDKAITALRTALEQQQQAGSVSMRMPKVGDRVICLEDESLGEVVSLTAGGSPDITFDDGTRGTYLLREFAELFGYAEQRQQQADPMTEPMTEVADRFAHRMALELECVLSDGTYSNKWYTSAMQVLSEYRSAMNAIHEQHSPTFMGEPKV